MEAGRRDIGELCTILKLDNDTRRLAGNLLSQCGSLERTTEDLSQGEAEELHRLETACFVYAAFKLRAKSAKSNSSGGTILPTLLPCLQISIADFLKELPGQVRLLIPAIPPRYAEDAERKIEVKEIQTSLVHSFLLSKKAKDTFDRFFKLPSSSPILKVMWLLFLVAKARLLQRYPELVTAYNMLLCVADFMLAHVQNAMAVIDFNDQSIFPVRTADGGPDTLASIVQVSGTSLTDTRPLAKKLNHLYQELFSTALIQRASFTFPDGKDIESRIGFSGLLAGDNINNVIALLDKAYQQALSETVEIDERSFIQQGAMEATAQKLGGSLTPPPSNRSVLGTPGGINRLISQTPSGLMRTPLRPVNHLMGTPPRQMGPGAFCVTPGPGIRTPISEAMRLAAWLKNTLDNAPDQPSEKVKEIVESCGADFAAIQKRTLYLSSIVFTSSPSRNSMSPQPDVMQQRAIEGIKLYYRVLDALLKEEAVRWDAQKDKLYNLIQNVNFHRCLMACAFEIIIASYGMASLTFPAVLERMQLQAFDLCTIVESFARHEPTLPKAMQIHLFRVEEMIMESLAWEKGSSFYPKLLEACVPEEYQARRPAELRASESRASETAENEQKVLEENQGSNNGQSQNTNADNGQNHKRSLEGENEDSPPKLQKGKDESKVIPQASLVDASKSGDSPSSPPHAAQKPLDSKPRDSPPATPRRSLGQPLAERVPSTPLNLSKKSAFSVFMSPQRATEERRTPDEKIQLPMNFGDPDKDIGKAQARKLLVDFLNKVIRLGLHRASELCDRIDLSPHDPKQILKEVYTMIHRIVWDNTHLLYNRHLDQIVLCSLYAICKVHTLDKISFRELASHYRKMPRTKIDTYRTVVVEQSEPDMMVTKSGDIIMFYNNVFIPLMKNLVLKIGTGQNETVELPSNGGASVRRAPLTPKLPTNLTQNQNTVPMTPPSTRKGSIGASPLSGRIFVYKQSPKKPFLSPKTKIFYCGRMGESAHEYQSPSKDLKYINSRIHAHSQSPVTVQAIPEQVGPEPAGKQSQNHVSSEPSYSSARSSEEARSVSPSRITNEGPGSQPNPIFAGISRLGSSHLPQNGHTYAHRTGGSGLEDLHNAAMLLGSQDAAKMDSQDGIRRSRRQMGYSPRN